MKRFTDWFNNLYPVWLVSLAVIASLTYPHAAVVAWMDHRQAVWRAQLRS